MACDSTIQGTLLIDDQQVGIERCDTSQRFDQQGVELVLERGDRVRALFSGPLGATQRVLILLYDPDTETLVEYGDCATGLIELDNFSVRGLDAVRGDVRIECREIMPHIVGDLRFSGCA